MALVEAFAAAGIKLAEIEQERMPHVPFVQILVQEFLPLLDHVSD